MLYEYAGVNPVKAISNDFYSVLIKDQFGNIIQLTAVNHLDRLKIDGADKLHHILLLGGEIQFCIEGHYHCQYNFTIKNADWYENAYTKLTHCK